MSPWLFNIYIYMDCGVRWVNVRVLLAGAAECEWWQF